MKRLLVLPVILLAATEARAATFSCRGRLHIGIALSQVGPCVFADTSSAYRTILKSCARNAVCAVVGEGRRSRLHGEVLDHVTAAHRPLSSR